MDQVLLTTKSCRVSDPKDKICAALNLSQDTQRLNLEPDYSKTAEEVYQELVMNHITNFDDLGILQLCTSSGRLLNISSWVPDFSASLDDMSLLVTTPMRRTKPEAFYLGSGVLKVAGVYADTI